MAADGQQRARRTNGSSATGERGAISAGHPLAVEAGVAILASGGNALDAAIAAQAVICTVMPQAAGLGGDMLALVRAAGGVSAIGGAGRSPIQPLPAYPSEGGGSVTVPGIVDAWLTAHRRFGRLPLAEILRPAVGIARTGYRIDAGLRSAVQYQRERISRFGAAPWELLGLSEGELWIQPELAALLEAVAVAGSAAFYTGAAAEALVRAVRTHGGALAIEDLAEHRTVESDPVTTDWQGATLCVQPSPTQGVLLAMAAHWLDRNAGSVNTGRLQHALVEATEAAFAHRDDAARGAALLDLPLEVDLELAQHRGGPRAYLHTAGVAASDADGLVVSSLVSVFDDFGSGVFVPELGIMLNNRAGGFTSGANAPGPGKRPVHTLAPAMLVGPGGDALAVATPGADGQVQTLLQVLARVRFGAEALPDAIRAPRWRSQNGELLIESDHPDIEDLRARGHRLRLLEPGDDIFGAVVSAGTHGGIPSATSDWRRLVTTGAA